VADGQRQRLAGQRVWLGGYEDRAGVILVQVSAADSVESDLDLDGARGGFGFGHIGTSTLFGPKYTAAFMTPFYVT
jgi:hypothetical protein